MIDLRVDNFEKMTLLLKAAYTKRGRHEREWRTDIFTELNRHKTTARHLRSNT